jgi:hypothetical protein
VVRWSVEPKEKQDATQGVNPQHWQLQNDNPVQVLGRKLGSHVDRVLLAI